MENRTLGKTGISVSRYCLGTMMFGAMGNRDHEDCISIIHAALDGGVNFTRISAWSAAPRSAHADQHIVVGKPSRAVVVHYHYISQKDIARVLDGVGVGDQAARADLGRFSTLEERESGSIARFAIDSS